jgi:competence protein ComEA
MMKIVKQSVCILLLLVLLGIGFPAMAGEKVNLNSATVEQLIEIKGIGEVLAQRIVDYRQVHGNFKNLEELKNVKGVGDKTWEKLVPYLALAKE